MITEEYFVLQVVKDTNSTLDITNKLTKSQLKSDKDAVADENDDNDDDIYNDCVVVC